MVTSLPVDAMQDAICQLLGCSAVDYSSTRKGRDTAGAGQATAAFERPQASAYCIKGPFYIDLSLRAAQVHGRPR
jgi:hypothetical protein